MADRKVVPFLVPTFQQKGLKIIGQQKLTNCYFHMTPGLPDGRGQMSVLSCPGTISRVTTSGSLVRACISYNNVGYAVIDNKIFKITSGLVASDLGTTLSGSTGEASIAATGTEVVVCANSKIYRINTLTDVVTDITSVLTTINALNIPIWVLSQNSRFIYITSNANTVHISDLLNANSITSINGYQPNTIAGTISAGAVTPWFQYYFNENAVEVYRDTGAEIGPFSRVDGGAIPVGIAADKSVQSIMNKVYYLGRTESGLLGVIEINGLDYKVVSTPDFVETIKGYDSFSDAISWTDTHNGHLFYNITFPTVDTTIAYAYNDSVTWSYDITTNMWFIRTNFETSTGRSMRHIANCNMFLGGKQLVGSYRDGDFYEIDTSLYDDSGTELRREIITGTLVDRDMLFSIYNIEIDIERGIGDNSNIVIEVSKDRANTFPLSFIRELPNAGEYNKRVRVASLGSARSFALKLTMTDSIPWALTGITAELEGSIE